MAEHVRTAGILWDDEALSGLVRDRDLSIWMNGGLATAVTSDLIGANWKPHVRTFDLDTYAVGSKSLIKDIDADSDWESANVVIRVAPDFSVAFYSAWVNNRTRGRVATSSSHLGPFTRDPSIEVSPSWAQGTGRHFEFDPGFALKEDLGQNIVDYWIMGSVQPSSTVGPQIGWFWMRCDTAAKTVQYMGEHSLNPLASLDVGNDVRTSGSQPDLVNGEYVCHLLVKPNSSTYEIWQVRSNDPLHTSVISAQKILGPNPYDIDGWSWRARVVEKFTTYYRADDWVLLIDCKFEDQPQQWGFLAAEFSKWRAATIDDFMGDPSLRVRAGLIEEAF